MQKQVYKTGCHKGAHTSVGYNKYFDQKSTTILKVPFITHFKTLETFDSRFTLTKRASR